MQVTCYVCDGCGKRADDTAGWIGIDGEVTSASQFAAQSAGYVAYQGAACIVRISGAAHPRKFTSAHLCSMECLVLFVTGKNP